MIDVVEDGKKTDDNSFPDESDDVDRIRVEKST